MHNIAPPLSVAKRVGAVCGTDCITHTQYPPQGVRAANVCMCRTTLAPFLQGWSEVSRARIGDLLSFGFN